MERTKDSRRTLLSWVVAAALLLLCGGLGVLQYRWISEVSAAEAERTRASLQANLNQISRAFSNEISANYRALLPTPPPADSAEVQRALERRYPEWRKTPGSAIFGRVAIAVPDGEVSHLLMPDDHTGHFIKAEWPAAWNITKERIESRLGPREWFRRGPPPNARSEGLVFEAPVFGDHRESAWILFELDPEHIRSTVLPELLQRYLGQSGDYEIEVVSRRDPNEVFYRSDPVRAVGLEKQSDASTGLFDGAGFGPGPGGPGRWQLLARHRAGSVEALVAKTRLRNLIVTSAIFLLMIASVVALFRYTRKAQRLAALQMDFVAGVSHELRTPLTVIHTAAYNLRGRLAQNPSQVERYGALIQQESWRLKELVDQVLLFASSNAGRVIREIEPMSVQDVIERAMESARLAVQQSHCTVEKDVDPDIPVILGDPMALMHALQNLLNNAVKYGVEHGNWIGVFASSIDLNGEPYVEIRVADRGPGIPREEQEHVFDAFFRGRRAVQDQIHGAGLGLNLTRKIVEAHGGTIEVRSESMKGAEFVVRIPARRPEHVDEFADSIG